MGKNQSASNLPNIIQYSNGSINFVSGSTLLMQISSSGAITTTGVISGSNALSSSYASNSERLDNLDSTSFVFTSSYNSDSSSVSTRVTKIEGNYATTGSNIFLGVQTVCANITSTGTIIAQTLNVQQVTSSIVYSSGSNIFGCQLTDIQQMTGSLRVTGSGNHWFQAGCVGIGTTTPTARLHVGAGNQTPINGADTKIHIADATLGGRAALLTLASNCAGVCVEGQFESSAEIFADSRVILGSTSNHPLVIRTNNVERIRVTNGGLVGIGTSCPTALLHNSRACNSETNIYVENTCTGTGAGSSLYLVENTSTFTPGYGQLTHFNSGYSTNGLLVANRTWLAAQGGELLVGTRSAHDMILHTGGTASGCERMRITSAGVVQLGNSTATSGVRFQRTNGSTGQIGYITSDITGYSDMAGLAFTADNVSGGSQAGSIKFFTSNAAVVTDRLLISSAGIACFQNTVCAPFYAGGTSYAIDFVVVGAGGGGGGAEMSNGFGGGGGAGGAGGFLASSISVNCGSSYPITIGTGGAGGCSRLAADGSGLSGCPGTFSSAFGFIAIGGGGGGGDENGGCQTGGSGGGQGGDGGGSAGVAVIGQGCNGGTGGGRTGGGGGGASATGNNGGSGGAGRQWLDGCFYAGGGGGGGGGNNQTLSVGGNGGGGTGSRAYSGGGTSGEPGGQSTAGCPNTGGGGGGAGAGYLQGGQPGGTGIVVIRYFGPTRGSGGTISSCAGYTYHRFTSGGTFTA